MPVFWPWFASRHCSGLHTTAWLPGF